MFALPDPWRRTLRWLAGVAIVIIGILIAWPEPPAQLLVAADGWEIEGGFALTQPDTNGVPRSLRNNGGARFWRSWTPEHGAQPGILRSAPFELGGTIGVPYNGFAGSAGIATWLECVSSGLRLPLATQSNNTVWSIVLITPAPHWCDGQARVIAQSDSSALYVSLGTPYRVGWLSVFKHSPVAALWFVLMAWLLLASLILGAAGKLGQRLSTKSVPVALLIGLGLVGYAQFFAFWESVWLGRLTTLLMLLTAARFMPLATAPLRQAVGDEAAPGAALRHALWLWLLVAGAVMSIATMVDDGTGVWSANGRFAPAQWSSDNEIPTRMGELLVRTNHATDWGMGTWHISDRPPLIYGWHASLRLLGNALTFGNDGHHLAYLSDWAVGIVLNTLWVPVVCLLLGAIGTVDKHDVTVVTLCLLTPFFLFNSTYIWPKMLSAAFGLSAAGILLGLTDTRRLREDDRGLIAAATLSALAMLTHGGSVFGVLAAIALAPIFRGLPSARGALLAGFTGICLLLPWSLWQHFVDPPGTSLIKFAFAGTFGIGEDHVGVLDTIVRSYSTLGFRDWLYLKWQGLQSLGLGIATGCGIDDIVDTKTRFGAMRKADFFFTLPSLNFLLAGLLVLPKLRGRSTEGLAAPLRLVTFALTAIGLTWLVTWDCHINHHQAYQALIALHLGLILALIRHGGWAWSALVANATYMLTVWLVDPLSMFPRYHLIAIATTIALLGFLVWNGRRGQQMSTGRHA